MFQSGAKNSKEVIDIINEKAYSLDLLRTFREENFPILDGEATLRIIDLITDK